MIVKRDLLFEFKETSEAEARGLSGSHMGACKCPFDSPGEVQKVDKCASGGGSSADRVQVRLSARRKRRIVTHQDQCGPNYDVSYGG